MLRSPSGTRGLPNSSCTFCPEKHSLPSSVLMPHLARRVSGMGGWGAAHVSRRYFSRRVDPYSELSRSCARLLLHEGISSCLCLHASACLLLMQSSHASVSLTRDTVPEFMSSVKKLYMSPRVSGGAVAATYRETAC